MSMFSSENVENSRVRHLPFIIIIIILFCFVLFTERFMLSRLHCAHALEIHSYPTIYPENATIRKHSLLESSKEGHRRNIQGAFHSFALVNLGKNK